MYALYGIIYILSYKMYYEYIKIVPIFGKIWGIKNITII
jgi:hypothetical protein